MLGLFVDKHYCIRRHPLFASDKAEVLGGGGFDADLVGGDIHHLSETSLHSRDIRIEFWQLRTHGAIAVDEVVACVAKHLHNAPKENFGVNTFEFVPLSVGEMVADVAHGCSTE